MAARAAVFPSSFARLGTGTPNVGQCRSQLDSICLHLILPSAKKTFVDGVTQAEYRG